MTQPRTEPYETTRVRAAIWREQARFKRAQPEAIDKAVAVFNSWDPDKVKALALIHRGLERGDLTPQEGAHLSLITTRYTEASVTERIVLLQVLMELSGQDVTGFRPPILR